MPISEPTAVFSIRDDRDMEIKQAVLQVYRALEEKGYTFASAQIEMVPQTFVTLTEEGDLKNMQKLIDFLEDNDDVQNVWHNWNQD